MSAPAGPCEWCGGPQLWTIRGGEMWVRCSGGCLPLWEEELPPRDSDKVSSARSSRAGREPLGKGGVGPYEGSAVDEGSDLIRSNIVEALPPGCLDVLWEGFDYGES